MLVKKSTFASDEVVQALAEDPRGGTWREVEDVVAHVGCSKGRCRYLIRYKGFSTAFDEWKKTCDVSEELVRDYEKLLGGACLAGPAGGGSHSTGPGIGSDGRAPIQSCRRSIHAVRFVALRSVGVESGGMLVRTWIGLPDGPIVSIGCVSRVVTYWGNC